MNRKDKRKIIVVIGALIVIVMILNITNNYIEKEREQLENSIHAIVIEEKSPLYGKASNKAKVIEELEVGSNIYILEEDTAKDGSKWYKVQYGDKKGYIEQEKADYYQKSEDEIVLMSDVSKFNIQYETIKDTKDYQRFLIQNDIQYVYIRAGGRGYGQEGNFYTDTEYQAFIDACEYLKIPYGFYFIDEAVNSEEITEEANWIEEFLKQNAGNYCLLPIAIDVEKYDYLETRTGEIWDIRATLVEDLIQKLKEKNIESILYTNANTANEYLSKIDTKFWLSYYTLDDEVPDDWYTQTNQIATENEELMEKTIAWQFTETGAGEQIEEDVDLSLVIRSKWELLEEIK